MKQPLTSVFLMLSSLLISLLVSCGGTAPNDGTVDVFAKDSSYKALPDLEVPWYGTLQAIGRNGTALGGAYYAVKYAQDVQLMRTENVLPRLENLITTGAS